MIKFAEDIIKEIENDKKERKDTSSQGYVNRETFEEWMRRERKKKQE